MTARDDLARILHDATCHDQRCDPMTYDYRAADAVIAAGWAPPISSLYNDIQHARAIADGKSGRRSMSKTTAPDDR